MPAEGLSMRKIREVLRLRLGHGLTQRAVAQILRLPLKSPAVEVGDYVSRLALH